MAGDGELRCGSEPAAEGGARVEEQDGLSGDVEREDEELKMEGGGSRARVGDCERGVRVGTGTNGQHTTYWQVTPRSLTSLKKALVPIGGIKRPAGAGTSSRTRRTLQSFLKMRYCMKRMNSPLLSQQGSSCGTTKRSASNVSESSGEVFG